MRKILMYPYALLLLISFQTVAQTSLPTGYPDRNPALDVLPGFVNPPKGYGDVPFYWWQGDTITRPAGRGRLVG